ncbi:MAG: aminotransferase class I/II-fold pyridoxal phosphate-dependent enzyme [Solirubrobacterales bacterium]
MATMTDGLLGQPMFQLMQVADEMARNGRDVLHFEIGDLDFGSPPVAVDAAKLALDAGETGYADSRGLREMREAVAARVEATLGFRPALGQILVSPANAVIDYVVRCVADPGEEVVIPDPCFPTYLAVLSYTGVRGRAVQLDFDAGFDMHPDRVAAAITDATKLIVLNSPSNPTGGCLTKESVREIARLAAARDCLLLSDEVYASLSYDRPHYSPAGIDRCRERTIVLGSLSKSMAMAGWRLGYAIGPEPLIEKMSLLQETILSCLPPFIQRGGVAALTSSDAVTERILPPLRRRRDRLVAGLAALPGVECAVPNGAFYAFPRIDHPTLNDVEYALRLLSEEAICVVPGSHFGPGGAGFVRFSYSAAPLENIEAALERLGRFHTRHFERLRSGV